MQRKCVGGPHDGLVMPIALKPGETVWVFSGDNDHDESLEPYLVAAGDELLWLGSSAKAAVSPLDLVSNPDGC